MANHLINTDFKHKRVSSTYAETYLDDSYCPVKQKSEVISSTAEVIPLGTGDGEWISPSDLLIGILEIQPPFTSKITRGKTHEGIIAIGNDIMEKKRSKFLERLNELLEDNASCWEEILNQEMNKVNKQVVNEYQQIFKEKSKIMYSEISKFFAKTLQELEEHIHAEVELELTKIHANIVSKLNMEIKEKLQAQRLKIEQILKNKYNFEVQKIEHYYKLLSRNQFQINSKILTNSITTRNFALQSFCRQMETKKTTTSMYIMCMERKKCKFKTFLLENYQSLEIKEKLQSFKDRSDYLERIKNNAENITDINQEWEEKIKKILEIFLKFICFSLKLLPEQSMFLLELQKMVVLQLNEIQKHPQNVTSILVEDDQLFEFEPQLPSPPTCKKEPFVVVGDTSDSTIPVYGSRETLSSNVELPFMRLQRQFVYAKCKKFDQVRDLLEAQRCKCHDKPKESVIPEPSDTSVVAEQYLDNIQSRDSESSNETLLIDDIHRLHQCPVRSCQDWLKKHQFPVLEDYLDFNEDNYRRVQAILGKVTPAEPTPEYVKPKDYAYQPLPFAITNELHHTVDTQYSSREDVYVPIEACTCVSDLVKPNQSDHTIKETQSKIDEIMTKRKISLKRLLQQKPKLLNFFTEENFDLQL